MGTNYYLSDKAHIGKESAGGLYCWDCKITLCKEGASGIHCSNDWHKTCPECKKSINEVSPNAAFKQLGFLKKEDIPVKKGVTSISTFTWAIKPERLKKIRKIKDEYNRALTKKEFEDLLKNWCPVQYYHSIGREFC